VHYLKIINILKIFETITWIKIRTGDLFSEINITGMLLLDKLPIFFLKPTPACLCLAILSRDPSKEGGSKLAILIRKN
jgi:hypothetical protein